MNWILTIVFYLVSLPALAQTTPAPAQTPTPSAVAKPSSTTAGQKAYISERLNLGLYLQPDPTATPVKSLPSGLQVQVLETRDGFARIRMVDGNEGWARAEFITTEPPAKVLLQQMTRERDQLREQSNAQMASAVAQLTQARQKIQQLEQQGANPEGESSAQTDTHNQYQQAQHRIEQLEQQLANRAGAKSGDNIAIKILGLLATLLLSIGLGAMLGARWLGARVRRRFNGLKVW